MSTHKIRYTTLADDVSGAADACYCLTQLAYACVLTLQPEHVSPEKDGSETIYIGVTNDRGLRGDALVERWARWKHFVQQGLQQGEMILKIDSLGRGSWPERLQQILALNEAPQMTLLLPAIPPAGRTTVGGYQLLDGVSLDQTEAAHDPTSPVMSAYMPELARKACEDVRVLSLQDVRQGPQHISAVLRSAIASDAARIVMVADAETLDDIRALIRGVRIAHVSPLWVGATSLIEMLVEAEVQQMSEQPAPAPAFRSMVNKPTLYVVGSLSPIVRQELNVMHVPMVYIVPGLGLVDEENNLQDTASDRDLAALTRLQGDSYIWEEVLATVHATIDKLFSARSWGLIVATGGDTTAAVVEGLQGWGLQLISKVNVGTVLGTILGGPYEGFPLVTKVGSMGSLRILPSKTTDTSTSAIREE
ncbi:four-carbon acid sugar kinase family protein [Ktedonobacteria bacterium brp13]|nr:four-carbon acid sugar kinase family protein [Ktedonobacteria bacterium brp13]